MFSMNFSTLIETSNVFSIIMLLETEPHGIRWLYYHYYYYWKRKKFKNGIKIDFLTFNRTHRIDLDCICITGGYKLNMLFMYSYSEWLQNDYASGVPSTKVWIKYNNNTFSEFSDVYYVVVWIGRVKMFVTQFTTYCVLWKNMIKCYTDADKQQNFLIQTG